MGNTNVKQEEFEKAFDSLTTTITACTIKQKKKICTKEDCNSCQLYQWVNNCLNQLPDIYKIRVMTEVDNKVYVINSKEEEDNKEYATGWDAFKISADFYIRDFFSSIFPVLMTPVAAVLIIFLLGAGFSCCSEKLYGQSRNDFDYTRFALPGEAGYAGKYRKQILDTLDKTQKYITDINNDGEINCIDYTCTFKMLWDKSFNANDCEIVRNKSKTMNHLFIRVRQYAACPWECIEPQAATKDITNYFMEDFWDPILYNPIYNIYGETDYWLKSSNCNIN